MAPSKGSFQGLGLSPNILKGLAQMNYRLPTPVQRRSLPHSLSGVDTVVMARTGSGKTAAFLIPLLEKLKSHSRVVGCRAIVMSPSRELASQTLSFAKKMGRFTGIRFALIVGGDSMEKQFETLASNPDIIICTPGRLMHHLKEIKELSLKSVEMVIFDEADRLFEMGFAEQIHEIMRTIPEHRQNLLFSATMPPVLVQFARAGLMDPVLIRLDTDTKISESLSLAFFTVRNEDKPACLLFLLRQVIPSGNMTAIFAPTQHHVVFLQQLLAEAGISASVVYGSLDQQARQENLDCFRHGKTKLLLVTDVAARGIDIPLLNNVINYAFPFVPKLFVHRGGRAARQGRPGVAFSFVAPDELPYMIDLYKYLGKEPISPEDVDSSCSYDMSEITPANTHFGSFPQCVLDDEIEATRQIISRSRQSMLQQLENVARNAEKQYKRMRTDPDKRSIKASKQLNIGQVHPMLRKFDGGEAELEKKVYIDTMSSFRPKETILEVLGKGVKTGEDVMGAMRKKGRLSRLLNSAAAKTTTNQQMTTEKDSCDVEGGEGTKLNQADVGLAYIVNGVDNHCDVRKDGVMKDKYNEDEKDDESSSPHNPILGELALKSSSGQAKPRLSRAARKKLKKAEKEGEPVAVAPCVLSTCKGERKQKHREQQFGGGGKGMGAYADPEHFIGYGIDEATAMVNASLEPRTVEKACDSFAADRLAEAMLDVDPDEAVDLARKRRMLHWDPRKKKYIKTSLQELGESKKNKIRNEAGVIISTQKDKPGQAYRIWKKKTHKEVGSQGTLETSSSDWSHDRRVAGRRKTGAQEVGNNDLRSRDQIRKEKKKQENVKLKNITKSKRRHLLQKSKQAYEAKQMSKRQYNVKGKTRSRMLVIK